MYSVTYSPLYPTGPQAMLGSASYPKPFEEILTTLEAAIGHPDMFEFMKAMHASSTFAEFESTVHKQLGTTGLMMFMKFDQAAVLRKETGLNTPKIVRYVKPIGTDNTSRLSL